MSHAADGRLCITAQDHGTGLPAGFRMDGTGGIRLRVVSTVVEQLGGTIRAETDGGATFTILVSED